MKLFCYIMLMLTAIAADATAIVAVVVLVNALDQKERGYF